jgi:hypothetical protein
VHNPDGSIPYLNRRLGYSLSRALTPDTPTRRKDPGVAAVDLCMTSQAPVPPSLARRRAQGLHKCPGIRSRLQLMSTLPLILSGEETPAQAPPTRYVGPRCGFDLTCRRGSNTHALLRAARGHGQVCDLGRTDHRGEEFCRAPGPPAGFRGGPCPHPRRACTVYGHSFRWALCHTGESTTSISTCANVPRVRSASLQGRRGR